MAIATTAVVTRPGRRGRPDMVTIRRTTLIAGLIEGIALAQEVIGGAGRIQNAAATGSRQLVANEAGRLGHRATRAAQEFRRLIADVEDPA